MPAIPMRGPNDCSQPRAQARRAYNNTAAILILRAARVCLLRRANLCSFDCWNGTPQVPAACGVTSL